MSQPAAGTLDRPVLRFHELPNRRLRLAKMLGPAFVAAVAYVDPGNFATNVQGAAKYGYLLLWAVLAANLAAMLIQYLAGKLGAVTDEDLAELMRPRRRAMRLLVWAQAEVVAVATDIAEIVGAAVGISLLFPGVPLIAGGLVAVAGGLWLVAMRERGFDGHQRFERAIALALMVILAGFLYELLRIGPSPSQTLEGLRPRLYGGESLYLALAIVGATVMPHVIYVHSALTKKRVEPQAKQGNEGERKSFLRYLRTDVGVALGIAGFVNLLMLAVMAKLFEGSHAEGTLAEAHKLLGAIAGPAAVTFAIALLASGLAAAGVGTLSGQVVMGGLLNKRIRLPVRWLITAVPALVVLAIGASPTDSLVLTQVLLSFGIPFALIPLIVLTSRKDTMGEYVNRLPTIVVASTIAAAIVAANVYLLWLQFF